MPGGYFGKALHLDYSKHPILCYWSGLKYYGLKNVLGVKVNVNSSTQVLQNIICLTSFEGYISTFFNNIIIDNNIILKENKIMCHITTDSVSK